MKVTDRPEAAGHQLIRIAAIPAGGYAIRLFPESGRSPATPAAAFPALRYLALRETAASKQEVVEHVIRHPNVMRQNCRPKTKLALMSLEKRSCMARAQALMEEATPESLRYGALELRLCIEALTYEKLRAFSNVVPEDVLKTWQPPQAVKALLEFEPHADRKVVLYAGIEEEYGKPAKDMKYVGTHSSLRLGWLRKHYNKLGNLLHAPAAGDSRAPDLTALKEYLAEVIADLQEPLQSTITGGSFREVFNFTCSECGKPVIANAETVREKKKAVCLNPQCKAEYFAQVNETGQTTFQLMVTVFECTGEGCDGAAQIENRKLDVGVEFACPKCGLKHAIVHRQWGYGPRQG